MKTFDLFAVLAIGTGCLVAGAGWIYKPAGLIVLGVMLIALAVSAPFFLAIKK